MMRNYLLSGLAVAVLAAGGSAAAQETDALEVQIRQQVGQAPDALRRTPIPGLYEASFGTAVVYFSEDGKYLLRGELLDLASRTSLTEQRMADLRVTQLDAVARDSVISFQAPEEKYRIAVFTDIDCGYCRQLHSEMDDYLKAGISVDYFAYPRAGLNSESYQKAVNVWCSVNPREAMTDAKAGRTVPRSSCDNPVAEHMSLGERIGVNGTPAIFLRDGQKIGGYVPASRLTEILEERL